MSPLWPQFCQGHAVPRARLFSHSTAWLWCDAVSYLPHHLKPSVSQKHSQDLCFLLSCYKTLKSVKRSQQHHLVTSYQLQVGLREEEFTELTVVAAMCCDCRSFHQMAQFMHNDVIFRCSGYGGVSQQHTISHSIIPIAHAIVTTTLVCFPAMSDVYHLDIVSLETCNLNPEVHFTCSLHTRNRKGPNKLLNNFK